MAPMGRQQMEIPLEPDSEDGAAPESLGNSDSVNWLQPSGMSALTHMLMHATFTLSKAWLHSWLGPH